MYKVAQNAIFSRIKKFDDSQVNLVQHFFLNNVKFQNKHFNFSVLSERLYSLQFERKQKYISMNTDRQPEDRD